LRGFAKKLGKPNSTKESSTTYKTFNASTAPCTCVYKYGGYTPSTNPYGHINYVIGDHDSHSITAPADVRSFMATVNGCLSSKLGIREDQLPDYVVANMYETTQKIGSHSDSDDLFRTQDRPSTIVSINLHRDGVFLVKPNSDQSTKDFFGWSMNLKQRAMYGYDVHVLAKENSILVMGGTFQKKFTHETLTHAEIVELHSSCPVNEHPSKAEARCRIHHDYTTRMKNPADGNLRQVIRVFMNYRVWRNH
jgi:alkylated DNA repair dioxygenase AlkB